MTKFEIMFLIISGIHLFFEMLIVGALVKIEAAIMSKSTWEERQKE